MLEEKFYDKENKSKCCWFVIFSFLLLILVHACRNCHKNAHCEVDKCVCDEGYEGNGIICVSKYIIPFFNRPAYRMEKDGPRFLKFEKDSLNYRTIIGKNLAAWSISKSIKALCNLQTSSWTAFMLLLTPLSTSI